MMSNQWSLDISDDEVWADDDYLSRCWGNRVKRLKLRVNMRSAEQTLHIEGMVGVQYHNQQKQEWDPWKTRLGEWVIQDKPKRSIQQDLLGRQQSPSAAEQPKSCSFD